TIELGMQRAPRAGAVQDMFVGLGGDGEPVRYADALLGQLLEHLAERGVLAADERHVVDTKLFEEANVGQAAHDLILRLPAALVAAVGSAVGFADFRPCTKLGRAVMAPRICSAVILLTIWLVL